MEKGRQVERGMLRTANFFEKISKIRVFVFAEHPAMVANI